jgi:hypothetical protein
MSLLDAEVICWFCRWHGVLETCELREWIAVCPRCRSPYHWPHWLRKLGYEVTDAELQAAYWRWYYLRKAHQEITQCRERLQKEKEEQLRREKEEQHQRQQEEQFRKTVARGWLQHLKELRDREKSYRSLYYAQERQQRKIAAQAEERLMKWRDWLIERQFPDPRENVFPKSSPAWIVSSNRLRRVWVSPEGYLDESHIHVIPVEKKKVKKVR